VKPSFHSAAHDFVNGLADQLPLEAAAFTSAAQAYAQDFVERCAACSGDARTMLSIRLSLSSLKGFRARDFEKLVKEEKDRLRQPHNGTAKPNGHAKESAWESMLLRSEKGTPKALLANASTALRYAPEWKGVLSYNEMSRRPVKLRSSPAGECGNWSDVDDMRFAEWLQNNGIGVGSKVCFEASSIVAMESSFHPVRDYLKSLEWDGGSRISRLLPDYFGTESTELIWQFSAKWMISAVARAMNPACQVDTCLVLEGQQGIRKSTALRTLAVRDDWFTDQVSELFSGKEASQDLLGKWIIEIKEIDKLSNHEMGVVKGFMDRRVDHYRPSYGRRSDDFPRHNVFAATTNKREWAVDETGGRRWWPAWCENIKIDLLTRDRDQLWAEAFYEWRAGSRWHLDRDSESLAKDAQRSRFIEDAWHPEIVSFLDELTSSTLSKFTPGSVSVQEILTKLGVKIEKFDRTLAARAARCLIAEGWERFREAGGDRPWRYIKPPKP
jgi:putative DNA primase/helicase